MIRKASIKDLNTCIILFKQSVKTLCLKDYTQKQIKMWIKIDKEKWEEKFKNNDVFIYEKEGKIASFISIINCQKILDLLFTHPNFIKQGLAQNLLDFALKNYLYKEIYTFASLSAKDFFLKNNFKIVRENEVKRNDQILKNFLMKKEI
ncbi:GNAT family N-acetyltransferase [Campylobacter sp. 2018MI35]|uniref:GNAT family N-acetyltransferase n=1 Tax=Campylobacter sp. 2018MI34 TaxID=2800582 RepID=UPI001902E5BB|nr:GNAT family N-acetyltransferase [Campylobacter sp. 2018MI34]MBK1991426.1 GNAT family N-acetyltransferase [Campylobacter sp. 2018MI34]